MVHLSGVRMHRLSGSGRAAADSEPVQGCGPMDEAEIRARVEIARRDHRDLDSAIEALRLMPNVDMIQLQRFKKRKLRLRDEIAQLEDLLIPDIIA
jgi:hypothetical protein